MAVKESITALAAEYNEKTTAIREKIEAAQRRLEEIQREIRYINEKELPEAVTKSVLESDYTYENKVRKNPSKLEEEAAKKQDELAVLPNVLNNYRYEAGRKAEELHKLFVDERKLEDDAVKKRLMHAKYQFIEALEEAAPRLKETNDFDVQLQLIEYDAGLKNSVYTQMPAYSAPRKSDAYRYDGIYLAVPDEDINSILKGKMPPAELDYMKKFSDPKNL